MNILVTYLRLSFLITVCLLLGCAEQSDEAVADTVKKIIIALEPDKDPDAMLEDRAALAVSYTHLTLPTIYSV